MVPRLYVCDVTVLEPSNGLVDVLNVGSVGLLYPVWHLILLCLPRGQYDITADAQRRPVLLGRLRLVRPGAHRPPAPRLQPVVDGDDVATPAPAPAGPVLAPAAGAARARPDQRDGVFVAAGTPDDLEAVAGQ